ncbi:hypothetical protein BY996DRAFT_8395199 [Phakopsora pachyrhizi]|nr:hypothetical protein BY996DRAFT_8395199 [Phakopsora pachyrhizi]
MARFLKSPKESLANFDLNELPEDKGPDKSLYHVEGKTELENERDYSWNSKSQMIELAHWTLSPTSSKFSAKIGSVSKEPASSEDRMINESEFVRDVRDSYTNLGSKNQPERGHDQRSKYQHSFIALKEKNSRPIKTSLSEYLDKIRKRKKSDGSKVGHLFSEIKGKNKMMISSTEKAKFKVNHNRTAHYLDRFIRFLAAEVKNPGPFDIQGENRYRSPYNINLLGFIENNLENILSSEMGEKKISNYFLETTKKFFWNVDEGLFFLSEEEFKAAVISVDSKSHSACSPRWVENTREKNQSSNLDSSISNILFSSVFTNFLTYDKLSRFLVNDKMRQIAIAKFLELNSKLSELSKGDKHIRKGLQPNQDTTMSDKINATILKAAIKAIPSLNQDNFTLWRNRVVNMLDLQDLTDKLCKTDGRLKKMVDIQLRTILTSKLEPEIHANVITPEIEKDARGIWKVFKEFLRIKFNQNEIPDFITRIKGSLSKLFEVGLTIPQDVMAYLILDKLPTSLENISQQITHSDKEFTSELILQPS